MKTHGVSPKAFIMLALPFLLIFSAVSGYASGEVSTAQRSPLKPIEHKYVCMITNQAYEKEQIPVGIDSKTYYGCCEMCKETLLKEPDSRFAIDPVSGKKVDKALSVIGTTPEGKVYYFESIDNLKRFNEKTISNKE
jgi:YHS domain-containing protein